MYNLVKADLFKLRKSMAIKILFSITTISSIVMVIMAYMIKKGTLNASSTGIGFLLADANMIGILGAVIAGVFICGDFDNRTIHEAIVDGNSRYKVVISKTVILCLGTLIILVPYIVSSIVAISTGYKFNMGSVSIGFLNLITTEGGKITSSSQVLKLLLIMLTLAVVYAAQLSICVPLAIGSKKPVIVIAVYYGIAILSGQLGKLESSYKIFKKVFQCTPYSGKYYAMALDTGRGDVAKAIIVSFIFIIVMVAIACFLFRRSEIK